MANAIKRFWAEPAAGTENGKVKLCWDTVGDGTCHVDKVKASADQVANGFWVTLDKPPAQTFRLDFTAPDGKTYNKTLTVKINPPAGAAAKNPIKKFWSEPKTGQENDKVKLCWDTEGSGTCVVDNGFGTFTPSADEVANGYWCTLDNPPEQTFRLDFTVDGKTYSKSIKVKVKQRADAPVIEYFTFNRPDGAKGSPKEEETVFLHWKFDEATQKKVNLDESGASWFELTIHENDEERIWRQDVLKTQGLSQAEGAWGFGLLQVPGKWWVILKVFTPGGHAEKRVEWTCESNTDVPKILSFTASHRNKKGDWENCKKGKKNDKIMLDWNVSNFREIARKDGKAKLELNTSYKDWYDVSAEKVPYAVTLSMEPQQQFTLRAYNAAGAASFDAALLINVGPPGDKPQDDSVPLDTLGGVEPKKEEEDTLETDESMVIYFEGMPESYTGKLPTTKQVEAPRGSQVRLVWKVANFKRVQIYEAASDDGSYPKASQVFRGASKEWAGSACVKVDREGTDIFYFFLLADNDYLLGVGHTETARVIVHVHEKDQTVGPILLLGDGPDIADTTSVPAADASDPVSIEGAKSLPNLKVGFTGYTHTWKTKEFELGDWAKGQGKLTISLDGEFQLFESQVNVDAKKLKNPTGAAKDVLSDLVGQIIGNVLYKWEPEFESFEVKLKPSVTVSLEEVSFTPFTLSGAWKKAPGEVEMKMTASLVKIHEVEGKKQYEFPKVEASIGFSESWKEIKDKGEKLIGTHMLSDVGMFDGKFKVEGSFEITPNWKTLAEKIGVKLFEEVVDLAEEVGMKAFQIGALELSLVTAWFEMADAMITCFHEMGEFNRIQNTANMVGALFERGFRKAIASGWAETISDEEAEKAGEESGAAKDAEGIAAEAFREGAKSGVATRKKIWEHWSEEKGPEVRAAAEKQGKTLSDDDLREIFAACMRRESNLNKLAQNAHEKFMGQGRSAVIKQFFGKYEGDTGICNAAFCGVFGLRTYGVGDVTPCKYGHVHNQGWVDAVEWGRVPGDARVLYTGWRNKPLAQAGGRFWIEGWDCKSETEFWNG